MTYEHFFRALTGYAPFPYQVRLSEGEWPHGLEVPTGLGKTAAVLVAYLYRLLQGDRATGRRLVYCLPMRVLVEQTVRTAEVLTARARDAFEDRKLQVPTVHAMLGGYLDERWEGRPEVPAILVGTQDMLVSRALARGYAMSRYKWPLTLRGFITTARGCSTRPSSWVSPWKRPRSLRGFAAGSGRSARRTPCG